MSVILNLIASIIADTLLICSLVLCLVMIIYWRCTLPFWNFDDKDHKN
jgi:hypothetical protein